MAQFTFQAPSDPSLASGGGAQAAQEQQQLNGSAPSPIGQQGLQQLPGAQVEPTGNANLLATLLKMGEEIIAPEVKKAQTREYLDGWRRVAQGAAVEDIVQEQPAWTRIFGDSATVSGARALDNLTRVDRISNGVIQDMEKLRALDADSFQEELMKRFDSEMTGDLDSNTLLASKLGEVIIPLNKLYYQENGKYAQELQQENRMSAAVESAKALQLLTNKKLDNQTVSEESLKSAQVAMASTLMRWPGEMDDSHKKFLSAFAGKLAGEGDLHALNTLDDSGALASLSVEQQAAVRAQRDAAEKRIIDEREGDMLKNIVNMKIKIATEGLPAELLYNHLIDTNNKEAAKYGLRDRQFFSNSEVTSMMLSNASTLEQQRKALEKEQAKAKDEAYWRQAMQDAYMLGTPPSAFDKDHRDVYTEFVGQKFANDYTLADTDPDPKKRQSAVERLALKLNVFSTNMDADSFRPIRDMLRNGVLTENFTGSTAKAAALYKEFSKQPTGEIVAQTYFGADGVAKLKAFNNIMDRETQDVNAAWVLAKDRTAPRPQPEQVKAALVLMDKVGQFSRMTPGAKRDAAEDIARTIPPGFLSEPDSKEAVNWMTYVYKTTMAQGFQAGRFYIRKTPATPNWKALQFESNEAMGEAIRQLIIAKQKGLPIENDDWNARWISDNKFTFETFADAGREIEERVTPYITKDAKGKPVRALLINQVNAGRNKWDAPEHSVFSITEDELRQWNKNSTLVNQRLQDYQKKTYGVGKPQIGIPITTNRAQEWRNRQ